MLLVTAAGMWDNEGKETLKAASGFPGVENSRQDMGVLRTRNAGSANDGQILVQSKRLLAEKRRVRRTPISCREFSTPGLNKKPDMEINPIQTEADYEAALMEFFLLFNAEPGTDEGDKLAALTTLVDVYEKKHYPAAPPEPIEASLDFIKSHGRIW